METTEIKETSPDCEIVTTRTFNAPQKLVYKAWTDPEYLKNWWGPKGFTNTFNIFDLKVGGRWSFIMHGPERGSYPNECTFTVVREPELLTWDRQSNPIFQVEVIFEEIDKNKTRVTFKQKFEIAEECSTVKSFTVGKNDEMFDRLEDELTKMSL